MKKIHTAVLLAFLTAGLSFLSSCSSLPAQDYPEQSPEAPGEKTEIQQKLVETAADYVGTTSGSLTADDKSYNLDCSGAILAVYYKAGINLEKCYDNYSGNGVKRIYACLRDNKLIINTKTPKPGDLIFWDNTWDRNKDGKYNDYFTHVGMVIDIDEDGIIKYFHHNYRKGLIIEKMNLFTPDDTEANSPMRMKGSPPAPEGQYLASHLIRVFGRAWQLPFGFFR
ncbi:MAG: C40 family peptidase [Spirochaetales bacterium]|nr:C40 family peptidase [Spirochaetales bacterium]